MKTKTKIAGASVKSDSGARSRPVLSPHVNPAAGAPSFKLKSILVPMDFSQSSKKALHYAVALAGQFGAKLTVLNVVEPIGPTPDFAYNPLVMESEQITASARVHLKRLVEKEGIGPALIEKTLVRNGVPFNEICGAAESLKADLIVIATHGYTGLKHVLMGSTAERVVRHASCPVLVLRENEREFV